MPVVDLRAWVEIGAIVFLAVLGIARLLQKSETTATVNDARVAAAKQIIDQELKAIEARFEQANKEMSRLASYVQGLDTRWRQEFVTRDVCDARMDSVRRELNGQKEERP